MLNILWSLAFFLVALGILVTVHEFGHFFVARRCGVKVENFSIGFGKALWTYTDKLGTKYNLRCIPLGGYVKMLDSRVAEVTPELYHQAFNHKSASQRIAIMGAGSAANFLLAILIYWFIFMHGIVNIKPVIGDIIPHSIASQAGIVPGAEIKQVNDTKTSNWNDVRMAIIDAIGEKHINLITSPFDSAITHQVQLNLSHWSPHLDKEDPVITLGIIPRGPQIEPIIAKVLQNSAAEQAGIQIGDRILTVNNTPIGQWDNFEKTIQMNPNKIVKLTLDRNGQPITIEVSPHARKSSNGSLIGFLGIVPQVIPLSPEYQVVRQYGPFAALYESFAQTGRLVKTTLNTVGKMIVGDISPKVLGGPISIAKGAGISADYGFISFLMFLALISLNLGIINLFPLPILDGGHIMLLIFEKFKGAPLSEQVQEYCYRIGAILLMLLMGFVLFNDFSRF